MMNEKNVQVMLKAMFDEAKEKGTEICVPLKKAGFKCVRHIDFFQGYSASIYEAECEEGKIYFATVFASLPDGDILIDLISQDLVVSDSHFQMVSFYSIDEVLKVFDKYPNFFAYKVSLVRKERLGA